MIEGSGFGDGGYGDFHAGDADGEFGALACWWVDGEPLDPFFVHPGEVGLFENDEGGADDSFDGGACGLEDGGDVLQALAGLLLDGVSGEFAGGRIVWAGAGDEDESGGAHGLAVGGRRRWGVGGANDVSWHVSLRCGPGKAGGLRKGHRLTTLWRCRHCCP